MHAVSYPTIKLWVQYENDNADISLTQCSQKLAIYTVAICYVL